MLETLFQIIIPTILMSVLARASGGGIVPLPAVLSRLPELLFAGGISVGVYALHHSLLLSLLALLWSYIWMETGHGTAFHMARNPTSAQGDRKQTLSRVIDPLCRAVGAPLGGVFYCWTFMGLKGLLIGLPLFPFGLPLVVLWPLAYELGIRLEEANVTSERGMAGEWWAGAFTGLLLGLSLILS